MNRFWRQTAVFTAAVLCAHSSFAKTRWSANHTIPDADFIGSGELQFGWDGFLNTTSDNGILVTSQVPVTIGIGEWMTASAGWSDGITAGFKARILDEFHPAVPSLAVGVRNLYNNSMLTRSRSKNDLPEHTGELYLALSKGFELITTRFHGGVLSIPGSPTEQFNGFFGVEKYFGGSLYFTLEGYSFYDRLNLSLFGTFRFLPNDRAELYAGMIDLERLLFNRHGDLEMTLEPDFPNDLVKPGVSMGLTFTIPLKMGKNTQFRAVEDLYEEQNRDLAELRETVNNLTAQLETERFRVDSLTVRVDSVSAGVKNPVTPENFEEIYSRLLAYRSEYDKKSFNPEILRKIRDEIFAFEESGEAVLLYIVQKGDRNPALRTDAVSLLGMMKSQKAVPIFIGQLGEEKDRRMKIALITALGAIGDHSAAYALEHLSRSADEASAQAAREVLVSWFPEKVSDAPAVPEKTAEHSDESETALETEKADHGKTEKADHRKTEKADHGKTEKADHGKTEHK